MIQYKDYLIYYDPPPIPIRDCDWQFHHKDYDGPEDVRCGSGPSESDCREQIDELLEAS